jgi:hypothetical protein
VIIASPNKERGFDEDFVKVIKRMKNERKNKIFILFRRIVFKNPLL